MALEQACIEIMPKPWGSTELLPWSPANDAGVPIGELWFQRRTPDAPEPALLLKLLFTQEVLSIQVHPGDDDAKAMGLPHGKSEAWYVLSAAADAMVGVGLKSVLTPTQLRAAIANGSIADLVAWRKAVKGDVIVVPAGTIHAIGPGLVLAEIQQRSDTTFRLFDHGRARELHVEQGVSVADAGPAERQAPAQRLSDVRSVLAVNPHFILERLDLPAGSTWELEATHESWLAAIAGNAAIGELEVGIGQGCFIEDETVRVAAGRDGFSCLLAYDAATPDRDIIHRVDTDGASAPPAFVRSPVPFAQVRS